jgi:hypothetical protein
MAYFGIGRTITLVVATLLVGAAGTNAFRQATSGFRLVESARYGEDEVVGVLHVSRSDAYFEAQGKGSA